MTSVMTKLARMNLWHTVISCNRVDLCLVSLSADIQNHPLAIR